MKVSSRMFFSLRVVSKIDVGAAKMRQSCRHSSEEVPNTITTYRRQWCLELPFSLFVLDKAVYNVLEGVAERPWQQYWSRRREAENESTGGPCGLNRIDKSGRGSPPFPSLEIKLKATFLHSCTSTTSTKWAAKLGFVVNILTSFY
jgi:hypothetical protein